MTGWMVSTEIRTFGEQGGGVTASSNKVWVTFHSFSVLDFKIVSGSFFSIAVGILDMKDAETNQATRCFLGLNSFFRDGGMGREGWGTRKLPAISLCVALSVLSPRYHRPMQTNQPNEQTTNHTQKD